jgi:hypothetical protein
MYNDLRTVFKALQSFRKTGRAHEQAATPCAVSVTLSSARRDGRVDEGARLESVWTGNRLVSSNLTLSAILLSGIVFQEKFNCF